MPPWIRTIESPRPYRSQCSRRSTTLVRKCRTIRIGPFATPGARLLDQNSDIHDRVILRSCHASNALTQACDNTEPARHRDPLGRCPLHLCRIETSPLALYPLIGVTEVSRS